MKSTKTFSGNAAARLTLALSAAGLLTTALLCLQYTEPTHQMLCVRAVDLLKTSNPLYKEVDDYSSKIEQGAIDEDQKARPFNHFYNRSNGDGLLYHSYYQVLAEFYDFTLPVPPGQPPMYTNALQWAKVAGQDNFNWLDAIAYYSYLSSSRIQSYTALGHVVHCLQDMGQPDHGRCVPHPGSSMNDKFGQDETMEGYEMFYDKMKSGFSIGDTVMELPAIEDYFFKLSELSINRSIGLGLPKPGESAMGLKNADWKKFLVPAITGEWDPNVNIPWIGTIKAGNSTNKYYLYGQGIQEEVIEYSAGLLKLFYDIVNPPPYVKRVAIYQELVYEAPKYIAEWKDVKIACPQPEIGLVRERLLDIILNLPLYTGVNTRIEIEFGPVVGNPGEQINEESIVVRFAGAVRGKSSFTQSTDGTTGAIWESVSFPMPEVTSALLEVEARDLDNHLQGRDPLGNVLDSEPRTAAYVEPLTGYPWAYYEPGTDRNHTVIAVSK